MAKLFSGLERGSIEGRKIVGTWLGSVGPYSGILPQLPSCCVVKSGDHDFYSLFIPMPMISRMLICD